MGAEQFEQFQAGEVLDSAFTIAREQALYDYGHAGYTGSLAEKTEVVLRGNAATRKEADIFAEHDLRDNRHDKWGPAWAVQISEPKGFLFYGYASS